MSQERTPIEVKMGMTEEEAREALKSQTREQRKAKFVSVLDRGIVNDRLSVTVPPDIHGEWVRNDPLEIARLSSMGFWLDNTYSTKRAIHSDGSSANVIGDVIFMCTTRENKDLIDEVRREMSDRLVNPKSNKDKEEREFENNVRAATGGDIPAFTESDARRATLRDVLEQVDKQTLVQR